MGNMMKNTYLIILAIMIVFNLFKQGIGATLAFLAVCVAYFAIVFVLESIEKAIKKRKITKKVNNGM